jgi:hydroxylaminobenzene mutase
MVLVLAGLLMGAVVQSVANPRMGLSAHTGTVMNGILVIAMGAFWSRLGLSARQSSVGYWLVVYGSYANAVGLFLAAVFGTSRTTPLHGAGHAGTAWQESLVGALLVVGAGAARKCALAIALTNRPMTSRARAIRQDARCQSVARRRSRRAPSISNGRPAI